MVTNLSQPISQVDMLENKDILFDKSAISMCGRVLVGGVNWKIKKVRNSPVYLKFIMTLEERRNHNLNWDRWNPKLFLKLEYS